MKTRNMVVSMVLVLVFAILFILQIWQPDQTMY